MPPKHIVLIPFYHRRVILYMHRRAFALLKSMVNQKNASKMQNLILQNIHAKAAYGEAAHCHNARAKARRIQAHAQVKRDVCMRRFSQAVAYAHTQPRACAGRPWHMHVQHVQSKHDLCIRRLRQTVTSMCACAAKPQHMHAHTQIICPSYLHRFIQIATHIIRARTQAIHML